ncbi:MAG: FAD-dependent oxidoreductase [Acidiferrobacterales bacterium]|nr:FAD-dependent oxidoreductase [Acidiferrobacterales bacterium]
MRIVILGAGVIGITTAYELSRNQDFQITVVDSSPEPASEASGVNAAMIAPGHAFAWASPKVPAILLKSIFRNDQAFRLRFRFDMQFWRWTALFLKQCNNADAIRNTIQKHNLCVYSQKRLGTINRENDIDYERIAKGLLYVYRRDASFRAGVEHSKILQDNGQQLEVLGTDEVIDLEPAFEHACNRIAGAIYSPTCETGNSQIFCRKLARICELKGVEFLFDTKVKSIITESKRAQSVMTSNGEIEADLFVVCLGAYTPTVLKPIGINLPIYPVKGYSLTLPANQQQTNLSIGTVDEDNLVACSPIGQSVRATATAEFAGYDLTHKPKDFAPMMNAVQELLPHAAIYDKPIFRTCFRPMTPQGTPYIGYAKFPNLFVNSGQGHMGWTMSCGSAKIAADLIMGEKPEIDAEVFRPNRSVP